MVSSPKEQCMLPDSRMLETQEREGALLQRALAGEDMRDEIILYLQPRIAALASRVYHRWFDAFRRGTVVERGDLEHSAIVAMLESYGMAVTSANLYGYLMSTARIAMIHYLNGRTGHLMPVRNPRKRPVVLSLDLPRGGGQTLADELECELRLPTSSEHWCLLHIQQAIEALPEKQRTVIQRYFGLNGPPESLNQISTLFSSSTRTGSARHHYHRALATLRQALTVSIEHEQELLHQSHLGGAQ